MMVTPIQELGDFNGNRLWIKREDLLPFSFGGNKARKAELFFREIDRGGYDCVVTYGSGSSNHCRVTANACCQRGLRCHIISPLEASRPSFNSRMVALFGAEVTVVPVKAVHDTIENKLAALCAAGKRPFFIPGGGHGNKGTEAYVRCYDEIREQEKGLCVHFDCIFLASGTGTTQAGLVCGQLLRQDARQIIGISIARKCPYGREVVLQSIRDYLGEHAEEEAVQSSTVFLDRYTSGYGKRDDRVRETIEMVLKRYGIALDEVYTGKAFAGMSDYMKDIRGKSILFLHTGGTPLFFDALKEST